MSKVRSDRRVVVVAGLLLAAVAGCEALIGADFDVEAAPVGEGGGGNVASTGSTAEVHSSSSAGGDGGAGATTSTSSSTATASSSSSTTGGAGGGCPTTADVIADGLRFPWGIAVDATHVYWSSPDPDSPGNGAIVRAPKGGGATEIVASSQTKPNRLLIVGPYLFWTATGTQGLSDGAVRWIERARPGVVHTVAAGLRNPIPLVSDGTVLWFPNQVDDDVDGDILMELRVAVVGQEGSSRWAMVPRFPTALTFAGATVYGGSLRSPLTPGDDTVGSLWKVGVNSAPVSVAEVFVDGAPPPDAAMTAGGGRLAVTSQFRGRVDVYGTNGEPGPGTDGWDQPADVVYAGGWFYVAEYAGATISRVRGDGGGVECVVTGVDDVNGLAVDETTLYFTQYDAPSGAVRSIPLPP